MKPLLHEMDQIQASIEEAGFPEPRASIMLMEACASVALERGMTIEEAANEFGIDFSIPRVERMEAKLNDHDH